MEQMGGLGSRPNGPPEQSTVPGGERGIHMAGSFWTEPVNARHTTNTREPTESQGATKNTDFASQFFNSTGYSGEVLLPDIMEGDWGTPGHGQIGT